MNLLFELDMYLKQKRYPLVNSLLLMHNGETLIEQYYNRFTPESRNNLKSIWKSILAATLALCLERGAIKSLEDAIADYLPAFARQKHTYHKLITLRHLLTMSSGIYWNGGVHYHCPMMAQMLASGDWVTYLSEVAMADRPGTRFVYKEWDVILLSAVIGNAAGRPSHEICRDYLYNPLEIDSGPWGMSPCGVNYSVIEGVENQSDLCARDMAKIGLLFLQEGVWAGSRILSQAFVREAVTPLPCNPGYGFLWWLYGDHYGARGFGGQEINVYPGKKIVTVIQATATQRSKSYSDVSEWLVANAIN